VRNPCPSRLVEVTKRSGNWAEIAEVAMAAEALYVAMRRVRNTPDDSVEPLSVAQMTLVEPLLDDEFPVGQLAARADVSVPTATRMLNNLEGRGLVERHRSDQDDRKVLVRLTPSGAQVATSRRDRIRRRQATRLAQLSASERVAMARELRKLTALINAPGEAE
jgi:MarR family transcriptional regulator, organic hydroperoxide resistance regulator